MIKKFLLSVCFLFVCNMFSFAISNNIDNNDDINKEDDYVFEQEIKDKKDCEAKLKKAKKLYFYGKLDESAEYINDILLVDSNNDKANELRNKILLLKEKENFYKKSLISDYYIELRRAIKDGNYYEGFLFIEKIKELFPEDNLDSFYNRLTSEKELVLSTIEKNSDKKIFIQSIETFVSEKYIKATKLIAKLYEKYPKFVDFVGMSRYYTIKETNNSRVKVYYDKALRSLKNNRLGEARTYAEIAYSLQQENIKLKILIDQINMEII